MTCIRAMGSGFNCNLDIIRSFHQITNYVHLFVYKLDWGWKVGLHLGGEGNTPLGAGELRLGRGKLHLGGRGNPSVPPSVKH